MFEKKRRIPDPLEEDLAAIDRMWDPSSGWFVTATEEVLRTDPDVQYHAARRAQVKAIAEARKAELVAALLARHS